MALVDELIELTILSDLDKVHREERINGKTNTPRARGDDGQQQSDGDWFNSIGSVTENNSVYTRLADRAYERIRKSVTSENCLVDVERLKILGVNLLGEEGFLATSAKKPANIHELFLSMFCNGVGVTSQTMRSLLAQSHDVQAVKKKNKKKKQQHTDRGVKAKKYSTMTSTDIKNFTNESLEDHNTAMHNSKLDESDREGILDEVVRQWLGSTFSSEALLNEALLQYTEPDYERRRFREDVVESRALRPAEGQREMAVCVDNFTTAIRGGKLVLPGSQRGQMTEEMMNLLLPQRYVTNIGMTRTVLDCVCDNVIGLTSKRIVHESTCFENMTGLTDTDDILAQLSMDWENTKKTEVVDQDLEGQFHRLCSVSSTVVLFVALCRGMLPLMRDLTLVSVHGSNMDWSAEENGDIVCVIPPNHIVYFEGTFYCRVNCDYEDGTDSVVADTDPIALLSRVYSLKKEKKQPPTKCLSSGARA